MELEDLIVNEPGQNFARQGGVCVVEPKYMTPKALRYYQVGISAVQQHAFWRAADTEKKYRPAGGLWAPQRRAVATCIAYLGARSEGLVSESALVKMPTGTGKTAVIATLACALPQVKRILIVTPQRALVDQLLDDVHWRFWQNFGLVYKQGVFEKQSAGAVLTARDARDAGVLRLLPSTAAEIASISPAERLVVVSCTSLDWT